MKIGILFVIKEWIEILYVITGKNKYLFVIRS